MEIRGICARLNIMDSYATLWMFFSGFCSMIGFGSIMVILDEFGGSQNRGKSPG